MKKRTLLIAICLAVLALLVFVGCEKEEPHECSSWLDMWYTNDTHHWAQCPCGQEARNKGEHTFENWICTVCGYEAQRPEPIITYNNSYITAKKKEGKLIPSMIDSDYKYDTLDEAMRLAYPYNMVYVKSGTVKAMKVTAQIAVKCSIVWAQSEDMTKDYYYIVPQKYFGVEPNMTFHGDQKISWSAYEAGDPFYKYREVDGWSHYSIVENFYEYEEAVEIARSIYENADTYTRENPYVMLNTPTDNVMSDAGDLIFKGYKENLWITTEKPYEFYENNVLNERDVGYFHYQVGKLEGMYIVADENEKYDREKFLTANDLASLIEDSVDSHDNTTYFYGWTDDVETEVVDETAYEIYEFTDAKDMGVSESKENVFVGEGEDRRYYYHSEKIEAYPEE